MANILDSLGQELNLHLTANKYL